MDKDADELRGIVHASFLMPSPLERYRTGPIRRAIAGSVALISDGGPGPDFNRVVVLGPARPEEVFAPAEGFFGGAAGYSIVVEVGTAPLVEDALRARGWRLDEEEPALVLAPLPALAPSPPPDLAIRAVTDAVGLANFRAVSETPSPFLPSLAAALDPAVAVFVGYVAGQPAATARLACLGSLVEITGVVTVPQMRRRGYGAALTWAAIAAGRARGCSAATLTATPMGYPLYVRLGFRPAGVYRTYLPSEPHG